MRKKAKPKKNFDSSHFLMTALNPSSKTAMGTLPKYRDDGQKYIEPLVYVGHFTLWQSLSSLMVII